MKNTSSMILLLVALVVGGGAALVRQTLYQDSQSDNINLPPAISEQGKRQASSEMSLISVKGQPIRQQQAAIKKALSSDSNQETSQLENNIEIVSQDTLSNGMQITHYDLPKDKSNISPEDLKGLPKEMARQLLAPPPPLPPDMAKQLTAPKRALPAERKKQLANKKPPLPEDLNQQLQSGSIPVPEEYKMMSDIKPEINRQEPFRTK